jgi:hypothetical protein
MTIAVVFVRAKRARTYDGRRNDIVIFYNGNVYKSQQSMARATAAEKKLSIYHRFYRRTNRRFSTLETNVVTARKRDRRTYVLRLTFVSRNRLITHCSCYTLNSTRTNYYTPLKVVISVSNRIRTRIICKYAYVIRVHDCIYRVTEYQRITLLR